jgi:hypothetical protein
VSLYLRGRRSLMPPIAPTRPLIGKQIAREQPHDNAHLPDAATPVLPALVAAHAVLRRQPGHLERGGHLHYPVGCRPRRSPPFSPPACNRGRSRGASREPHAFRIGLSGGSASRGHDADHGRRPGARDLSSDAGKATWSRAACGPADRVALYRKPSWDRRRKGPENMRLGKAR